MKKIQMIHEQKPVNVSHDTYRRECRYTRGLQIPKEDFHQILDRMDEDTKLYFEFHNIAKKIEPGTFLNGYSGLAKNIANYYKNEKNTEILDLTNGRDFYVKII